MVWNYLFDGAEIDFDEQLLEQIEQKHNEKVESTLKEAKELCIAVDLLGESLLHYASECGNENIVKFLIKSGSKINQQNKDGNTPLLLATKKQHVAAIKILLESDADMYIRDNDGKNALQLALLTNPTNNEIVKLFLEQLSNECMSYSTEIAKKLMEIECPIYIAVLLKNIDVTVCILTESCAIDAKDTISGKTALHVAVENLDLEHVEKLVFLGADVNVKDAKGKTPLALLNDFNELEKGLSILETLVDAKTLLNSCDDDGSMQIRWIFENGPSEAIEMILETYYCDLDVVDENKQTIIHYLAKNCNSRIVEILKNEEDCVHLETIDLNARDKDGFTALHFAMEVGNINFVEYLTDEEVNMHILSNDGISPFIKAVESESKIENRAECVKILILSCANIDVFLGQFLKNYNTKATINRHFPLLEYLIAGLAMWKTIDMSFNQEILLKIELHTKLKEYYDLCMSELEKMKNEEFYGVSLFDILALKDNFLSKEYSILFRNLNPGLTEAVKKYKTISMYYDVLKDRACNPMGMRDIFSWMKRRKPECLLISVGAGIISGIIIGMILERFWWDVPDVCDDVWIE